MRNTAYLLLALLMLILPVAAQTPDSYSYQILYTGRTLGYARIPDQQTLPPKACLDSPLPKVCLDNPIAKEFLDQFDLASNNPETAQLPKFRIAMGDNFSPDLYGRSIHVDRSIPVPSCDGTPNGHYSPDIHLPKDYFNYDKGGWYIWCRPKDELIHTPFSDNVADFLIDAQYDTVVPGKHDFYFGPQHLRLIADYLRKDRVHRDSLGKEHVHRVQMLGENIIVASSLAPTAMNAHPRIPERLAQPCHWNTGKDHECYHTDFGPASLDLPDNVLPWKRQFVLRGARRASKEGTDTLFRQDELKNFKDSAVHYDEVFDRNSVEICAEPRPDTPADTEPGPATAGDPAKVLKPGKQCFHLVASYVICKAPPPHLKSTCKAIYPETDGIYKEEEQRASTDITFLFEKSDDHLIAGRNHMFCAKPSPDFATIFGDTNVPICQPFPVQVPMFWSNSEELDQPAPGMAACGQDPSIPCPYALVEDGKLKVAIFAVVDPDLLSNVGMLNTGWLNTKNQKWDTAAQITAPDYALLQTLELCNVSDDCRNAPKILMAQMSYARATQLISNSNFSSVFDVIITQASPEHDTDSIEKRYQGTKPRFTLTPPQPLSTDRVTGTLTQDAKLAQGKQMSMSVFTPQVYVATITKEKPPQAAPANRQVVTSAPPRQSCQASPPKPTTPPTQPDITTLPSPLKPHDFGPCWSLRNTSAAWDVPRPPEAPSPQTDLDLVKFPARPHRPSCPGNDENCLNLERLAKRYLHRQKLEETAQDKPLTNPAASDLLTQAVLLAMRNKLKTDAAIIQTRDLYDPDNQSYEEIDGAEIQDQINRVIWKGDEAIVLSVTGATIRKLLKQSTTFAQLDKNSLNTEIEMGRDLITLGIYPDPKDSDTYYINGAVMSDTALYTIAATDFISGGDTGYANLVPPDVLPAFRLRDFARKQVQPIAGLVCKEIADSHGACADMQLDPDYFDPSSQSPSDATPGFTTSQYYRAFARNFHMSRRPFLYSEEVVQQRPFLSLKLENLDFSETGVFINNFNKTAQNLAGISNPFIANKEGQTIGADYKARLVYDYRWGTAYMLSDSSFQYISSRSAQPLPPTPPSPPNPPTLAYNVFGLEAGGTIRLPVRRDRRGLKATTPDGVERPSWLSFQYSIRYEGQLIENFDSQVSLLTPLPGGVSDVTLQAPQVSTIYGRAGLRVESGDTYLETGLEEIDARGVLQSYALPQPSGLPTYYCFPQALGLLCGTDPSSNSPSDKIPINELMLAGNANLAVAPLTTAYLTPGAYLNFYWKFPLWSRRDANRADQSLYFTLTNKGDLYFNTASDTSVQTRYLDKLTPALNLPIWAGLSLTPKVDFILYENKINRFHYRALQPSVALSYTFNWREGMSWARALRYGAQTTTPSPAGTTH